MRYEARTDIGLVRSENQDTYRIKEIGDGILVIVCDGMGGHKSGSYASALAADCVVNAFEKNYADTEMDSIRDMLVASLSAANSEVYNESFASDERQGMGTTCVVAYIVGNMAYVANVGDSRAYLADGSGLLQITKDHTVVRMLLDQGRIIPNEIENHPQKHMLTRAIGAEKSVLIDFFEVNLEEGYRLFFCSDGLYNFCGSEEIHIHVMQNDIEKASEELVNLAKNKGGRDNITLAIIAD